MTARDLETLTELIHQLTILHTPHIEYYWNGSTKVARPTCGHCDTGDPFVTTWQGWPCPTMEIIWAVTRAT